jgi:long-chain acyl-CoA synthetase
MAVSAKNLVELLEAASTEFADRSAFGVKTPSGWRWTTYADFATDVARCRTALAKLGIGPGDRVCLVSNNRPEWAAIAYATYGRRAVLVPMYEAQPPPEWRFILADSGAKVVFASKPEIFAQVARYREELPALDHAIGFDLPDDDAGSYRSWLAQAGPTETPPLVPAPEDLAGCIYTSGTTGSPKGVLLTHKNYCANLDAIHATLPIDRDTTLSFLPWAHALGQTADLHAMLGAGTTIALNDEIANLIENLAVVRPTLLCAVPRIFNRVYDRVHERIAGKPRFIQNLFRNGIRAALKRKSGQRLSLSETLTLSLADRLIFAQSRRKLGGRLRYVVSGSAALNKDVAEFIDALGITIYEGYGLTETAPVVSVNHPAACRIGSVGPPVPGVRVVIDEQAADEAGQGEIIVYGDNVMRGYHGQPEATQEKLTPDGGCRTGDLGYLDDDGFLYITGRISEQYKLENGKFVAPAPLEEELKISPYIANAVLYGHNRPYNIALVVPDAEGIAKWADAAGIDVGDWTTSKPLRELIASELQRCGASMRSYERPRDFAIVTEDFTAANGLLTQTMKVRRELVVKKHAEVIAALYERAPGA